MNFSAREEPKLYVENSERRDAGRVQRGAADARVRLVRNVSSHQDDKFVRSDHRAIVVAATRQYSFLLQ